jgi:hypothetical protein
MVPFGVSHRSDDIPVRVHDCAASARVIVDVVDDTAAIVGVDGAFDLFYLGYSLVEVEGALVGATDGILV